MVGHQPLGAANQGGDGRALGQFDLLDAPPHHAAGCRIAVHHRLQGLGCAAAQRVHLGDVAAAHVRQQRSYRCLGRGDGNVDLPRLQQVYVGAPVDQSHHAAGAHALGEQAAHDVVLVVIGDGDEQVHLLDVFGFEQGLVGDVALQDQRDIEAGGQLFAAALVVLDDLDRVVALERARKPQADVAAARDHDPAYRLVLAAQLLHHLADILAGGEAEHLVAGLDHGGTLGHDRPVAAEDGGEAHVDVRYVLADVLQLVTHQRSALEGAHCHQAHASVGELQYLQRLGKLDQLDQVFGDQLLRANGVVHGKTVWRKQLLVGQVLRGAHARDAGGNVVLVRRDLAGHQIGFVALRYRDQHVRVFDAGPSQNRRIGRAAGDGAQVQPVLQQAQARAVDVYDGAV